MKYRKDIQLADEDAVSISEKVADLFCKDSGIPSECLIYNKETGLMSYCLDVHRWGEYSIEKYRCYGIWDLLIRDAQVRLTLPCPLEADGRHKQTSSYGDLSSTLGEFTDKLPFPIDEKSGVRLLNYTYDHTYSHDRMSRWSDFMRPVTAINSMRKMLGMPTLTQDITNVMLSKIPDIILSMKYYCELWNGSISEVYSSENDDQFGSCMAGESSERFELYDYLQCGGKLQILVIRNGNGEHCGRALVWYGTNPDDKYLDRIYTRRRNGVKLRDALAAVKEFCEDNGIHKCVHDECVSDVGLEFRRVSISVGCEPHSFEEFPYVDSMRHWFSDGRIRNSESTANAYRIGQMNQTDGSAEFDDDDNYVTLSCGSRCHVDDAIYVERYGEYYHTQDVVCVVNGEYELQEDCSQLDENHYPTRYGRSQRAHDDDVVTAHNGECILTNDAVEINGVGTCEYAHTDAVVEMPDGIFLLIEDDRVMQDEHGNYVYANTEATQQANA
jgi:hypothetical protein